MSEYNDTVAFNVSVVLENDREHNEAIRLTVAERIRDGLGQENVNPDDYREILRHDGAHDVAWNVRDVVSDYVHDHVAKRLGGKGSLLNGIWVTWMPTDTMANLIAVMFDFANADVWADIAGRFVPETPEDYALVLQWEEASEGGWFTPGDCQHCGKRSGH